MKIKVAWVGKTRDAWVREPVDEYFSRIKRYAPAELSEVREEKGAVPEEQRRRECDRLVRLLAPSASVMILDESGERLNSREFAAILARNRDSGVPETVFCIGGAYGFTDEFRKRGRLISLSPMTFTHQMARIFLLEQIYRAFTIMNNEPYHH